MKNIVKIISFIAMITIISTVLIICSTGCSVDMTDMAKDVSAQQEIADELAVNQKTPTDINYSLERYNLIRRAYWVNGQREKANSLVCEVEKPLGYIVLFSGNTVVGSFVVDGKVTSLNSYLTPNAWESVETYRGSHYLVSRELADVDGSYGENDAGIFFFTPDGKYIEWTGTYLYSDIPFIIDNPIVSYEVIE
ncbi:MAG: hypothetical protein ACI4A5_06310 [Hominilimicola sp.]